MSSGLRCRRLLIAQIWFFLSICTKELSCPWYYSEARDPTSLCLSTSLCSAFPPSYLTPSPVLATSKLHPYSSHTTGHAQEKCLARDRLTLLPLTRRTLQKPEWSLPSWNYCANVSSSPVDSCTTQGKEHHTSTPLPGSRQCHSCMELIPGCWRGSPAEAAGAAQCSGEDRQGN